MDINSGPRRRLRLPPWIVCCGALLPAMAMAEERQDYLLFLHLTGDHYADIPAGTDLSNRWQPAVTFLYTASTQRFRFLTELHAAYEEGERAGEVARLQLGWRPTPNLTVWAGRFHNPQSYWNTQYHHGVYLQTSISRPGIETSDDDGGLIASHFIGLDVDGGSPLGRFGRLRYELAAGTGAVLGEDGLESPGLVPASTDGRLTTSARLTFTPAAGWLPTLGLFYGHNRIPALPPLAVREVAQCVGGVFGNWEQQQLRLFTALFWLRNDVTTPGGGHVNGAFSSGYVQMEYRWNDAWTSYARLESSLGAGNDPYTVLFPQFIDQQGVIGQRWDVTPKQALKLEYARPHLAGLWTDRVSLEWSMVWP